MVVFWRRRVCCQGVYCVCCTIWCHLQSPEPEAHAHTRPISIGLKAAMKMGDVFCAPGIIGSILRKCVDGHKVFSPMLACKMNNHSVASPCEKVLERMFLFFVPLACLHRKLCTLTDRHLSVTGRPATIFRATLSSTFMTLPSVCVCVCRTKSSPTGQRDNLFNYISLVCNLMNQANF